MKTKNIITIHLFFWLYIVYQSIFPLFFSVIEKPFNFVEFIFSMLFTIANFYIFYWILPFIFNQKYKLLAFSYGLIIASVIGIIRTYAFLFFYKTLFPEDYANELASMKNAELQILIYHFRGSIVTCIYALLIYIVIEWLKSQRQRAELVTQKQASELALLRSQISPHFLFNTLNNIDSLISRDPDKASASMIKLSEIMRYMIYDTSGERVSLQKEIEYLESFIELQRLRIKDPDFISFKLIGDTADKIIAPMLFIPFIENAFKHGSRNVKTPGVIFTVEIKNNDLYFTSLNYYNYTPSLLKDKTSGIGLTNVKRRLELIYKDRYELIISNDNGIFNVSLKIKNLS
ncbi:MAG: hypothetical protein A2275_12630 [Bacteroidetes bacterium RIFOXYA12_FULL_35_11]|nr:MAG: hypothetical protein A2X01_00345 [Bacteroidetes bacterium GWF2_35_48]OFY74380.1 MAG: hypothetical protein A2275_12630 [Bacteroidetes bacterium RIFOXYA12_FULL_35_11]HBX53311.1 hypothetical protein [Bacteroidales bacterium]